MISDYLTFLENKTEEEVLQAVKEMLKGTDSKVLTYEDRLLVAVKGRGEYRLIGAHVDAPRLDIRPRGLVEHDGLTYLKTHYYGGVKKYQWFAIPLEVRGRVVRSDGKSLYVSVPAVIADFAPHLQREYEEKKVKELFDPEKLNLLVGGKKEEVLRKLRDEFGVEEEDLYASDLRVVPAFRPTLFGANREFIAAYGHDDRVCVFAAAKAFLEAEGENRLVLVLVDREEIGSVGETAATSRAVEVLLSKATGLDVPRLLSELFGAKAISADVTAAFDPMFADLYDKDTAPRLGEGVVIERYTGSKGKYFGSEAPSDLLAWLRRLFKERGVRYQFGTLGKIDRAGGGTIAMFFAERGMKVVDVGPPILSMHSPIEVVAVRDVEETYKAYRAFFEG